MRGSVKSSLEEPIGIVVGTVLAVSCTLGLVMGSSLFELGSSIPPIGDEGSASTVAVALAETAAEDEAPDLALPDAVSEEQAASLLVAAEDQPAADVPTAAGEPLLDETAETDTLIAEAVDQLIDEDVATSLVAIRPRPKPVLAAALVTETGPAQQLVSDSAPATEAEPRSAQVWATVHYSGDEAREAARAAASRLRAEGVTQVELVRVPFAVSFNQLRFFHGESETEARRLGEALTGGAGDAALTTLTVADFTRFRPTPRDGLIEIWISQ